MILNCIITDCNCNCRPQFKIMYHLPEHFCTRLPYLTNRTSCDEISQATEQNKIISSILEEKKKSKP